MAAAVGRGAGQRRRRPGWWTWVAAGGPGRMRTRSGPGPAPTVAMPSMRVTRRGRGPGEVQVQATARGQLPWPGLLCEAEHSACKRQGAPNQLACRQLKSQQSTSRGQSGSAAGACRSVTVSLCLYLSDCLSVWLPIYCSIAGTDNIELQDNRDTEHIRCRRWGLRRGGEHGSDNGDIVADPGGAGIEVRGQPAFLARRINHAAQPRSLGVNEMNLKANE